MQGYPEAIHVSSKARMEPEQMGPVEREKRSDELGNTVDEKGAVALHGPSGLV